MTESRAGNRTLLVKCLELPLPSAQEYRRVKLVTWSVGLQVGSCQLGPRRTWEEGVIEKMPP